MYCKQYRFVTFAIFSLNLANLTKITSISLSDFPKSNIVNIAHAAIKKGMFNSHVEFPLHVLNPEGLEFVLDFLIECTPAVITPAEVNSGFPDMKDCPEISPDIEPSTLPLSSS